MSIITTIIMIYSNQQSLFYLFVSVQLVELHICKCKEQFVRIDKLQKKAIPWAYYGYYYS